MSTGVTVGLRAKRTIIAYREKEDLEEDMNSFRREYVFLLQSCIRIPLSDQHSIDVLQVKLLGGDVVSSLLMSICSRERLNILEHPFLVDSDF